MGRGWPMGTNFLIIVKSAGGVMSSTVTIVHNTVLYTSKFLV